MSPHALDCCKKCVCAVQIAIAAAGELAIRTSSACGKADQNSVPDRRDVVAEDVQPKYKPSQAALTAFFRLHEPADPTWTAKFIVLEVPIARKRGPIDIVLYS